MLLLDRFAVLAGGVDVAEKVLDPLVALLELLAEVGDDLVLAEDLLAEGGRPAFELLLDGVARNEPASG